MKFLKKLGKSVKGLTKMISIKNVVGVATGEKKLGGLVKEAVGRVAAGFKGNSATAKGNSQVIQNVVTAAATAGVGAYNGSTGGKLSDAAAPLANQMLWSMIKNFFSEHWKKVAIAVGLLLAGIFAWKKFGSNSNSKKSYKRR